MATTTRRRSNGTSDTSTSTGSRTHRSSMIGAEVEEQGSVLQKQKQQQYRVVTVRNQRRMGVDGITYLLLLLLLQYTCTLINCINAYPVLIQIEETTERCIRFNIPDGDDAHLAAIVLPSIDELDGDESIEDWYVSQVYDLCYRQRGKYQVLKRELPGLDTIPDSVALAKSTYLQEYHTTETKLKIKITGTPASDPKTFQHVYSTKLFDPIIVNHVGRTTDARARKPKHGEQAYRTGSDHLEGYGICFHNQHPDKQLQVVFAIVLTGEDEYNDINTKSNNPNFDKERHLTPLEISLEQSIHNARTILREMNYLEKRENRMRLTAESINVRVRWFSYLSVSVLLTVTYIQVTYLKRYFHKKKLM